MSLSAGETLCDLRNSVLFWGSSVVAADGLRVAHRNGERGRRSLIECTTEEFLVGEHGGQKMDPRYRSEAL